MSDVRASMLRLMAPSRSISHLTIGSAAMISVGGTLNWMSATFSANDLGISAMNSTGLPPPSLRNSQRSAGWMAVSVSAQLAAISTNTPGAICSGSKAYVR